MCLAVPGRVVAINPASNIATVEVGGTRRTAGVDLVPQTAVGDWVLVHAGFVINRIDEEEARETLRLLQAYAGTESLTGEGV